MAAIAVIAVFTDVLHCLKFCLSDAVLSRHIIDGATADDIEAFARANGMETLLIQGIRAVEDGLTTPEEIYCVLYVPHDK